MKFNLLDQIQTLTDDRIVAVKAVSLGEDYLADHFPTFPVLPGVLMVEAMVQAAAWLIHHRTKFTCSVVVLKEAKNVRYGQFVSPGQTLRVEIDLIRFDEGFASFKAVGFVVEQATSNGGGTNGGSGNRAATESQALAARLELVFFNLADKDATLARYDAPMKKFTRERFQILTSSGMRMPQSAEVLI